MIVNFQLNQVKATLLQLKVQYYNNNNKIIIIITVDSCANEYLVVADDLSEVNENSILPSSSGGIGSSLIH